MDKSLRPYLLELIGTFAVVFVSAGIVCTNALAAIAWQPHPTLPEVVIVQPQPGLIGIALACGFIYAAALAATRSYSEGYLNPAFPIMLWVFKRMDTGIAMGLVGVQLLGAAAAGGLLRVIFWFREDVLTSARLGTPHLNFRAFDVSGVSGFKLLSGIGMELVLTFVLTFVIFATLIDPRANRYLGGWVKRGACLWAGLAVAAGTLVGFPLTGAAMNPARWFGTVFWEKTIPSLNMQYPFQDQVIYWFGPIAGALLAGLIYTTVIAPAGQEMPAAGPSLPPSGRHTGAGATLFRK